MIFPVTGQRAISVEPAGAEITEASARGRGDVSHIEIDEMRCIGHTVGIVAGRAGDLIVHDVPAVKGKAGITQYAITTMAFITQRIIRRIFGGVIRQNLLAFEDRGKIGSVRAVWPRAAGSRAVVIVMAIGAFHVTRSGPGSNQAGNIAVSAGRGDRMKGSVAGIKGEPGIGLHKLAGNIRRAAADAVRMAAIAEFVFVDDGAEDGAGGVDPDSAGDRTAGIGCAGQ